MQTRTTKLGRHLVSWRRKKGEELGLPGPLTRTAAAQMIGISRQWLIDIEEGRRLPCQIRLLRALQDVTGAKPADWWEAA